MIKNKIPQVTNGININGEPVVTLLVDGYAFYREYTDNTIAATCTAQGYTSHTAKDGKNQSFNAVNGEEWPYSYTENIIPALGHNMKSQSKLADYTWAYADSIQWSYYCCSVCGGIEREPFSGHTHTYHYCTRCNYNYWTT